MKEQSLWLWFLTSLAYQTQALLLPYSTSRPLSLIHCHSRTPPVIDASYLQPGPVDLHTTEFDIIGEHTGADHGCNVMMPFGGKPPGSEGLDHNREICLPEIWKSTNKHCSCMLELASFHHRQVTAQPASLNAREREANEEIKWSKAFASSLIN
ncbi:hypothetical protein M5K25_003754 [Dendrobium thyrsiflorum]|uniref:Uncharacterized protein n=1 Tax=Dendrobium thyrsiflorum TaxID=117978 RepID=A0ABD0VL16_DENTH